MVLLLGYAFMFSYIIIIVTISTPNYRTRCFFFTQTPLDVSHRLNNTKSTSTKQHEWVDEMEDESKVMWRSTTLQDPASWWKQCDDWPAVDGLGKQQIPLHLTEHKYLYVDSVVGCIHTHCSYTVWHVGAISFYVVLNKGFWLTTSKAFTFLSSEQLFCNL